MIYVLQKHSDRYTDTVCYGHAPEELIGHVKNIEEQDVQWEVDGYVYETGRYSSTIYGQYYNYEYCILLLPNVKEL